MNVSGCQKVAAAYFVVVCIQSIKIVDQQYYYMNHVHYFGTGVLFGVSEWLECEYIGQEDGTKKEKDDSTVLPLVKKRH